MAASVDGAGEFPFAPEDYLLHLLAALATFREAALDQALRPLELTVSRYRVLSALVRCGAATMSELASFIAADRTTLTRVADQLVAAGLVERITDLKDRRYVMLAITPAGLALYRRGADVLRAANQQVVEGAAAPALRGLARTAIGLLENATDNEATRASLIDYRRPGADSAAQTAEPPSIVPDPKGEFPLQAQDYALHLIAAMSSIRDVALDAALRPIGLSMSRYRVLGALSRFGAMSMTEVAGFTLHDRTTLTRVADHLVADEYVTRLAAPKDRRQVLLEITEAGREKYREALPILFAYNRSLLAGLTAAEIRSAARTLKGLVAGIASNPTIRSFLIEFARPEAA